MNRTLFSRDTALLAARVTLSSLFIVMGWGKLSDYSGAIAYMAQTGSPFPTLSALIAILAELGTGLALILGLWVTPLAVLLAAYTVVTAFIGHHFWTMTGTLRYDMTIHFYKNISIAGGLIALAVAGPGHFIVQRHRHAT
ncbi:DoxX family membrane protein [Acetobacter musti]|uniref:DoxX family membrane protein n=1 Tax=Acetobacter musti TaxID=864732 RepID=A0ABX0JSQ8_9PROT|nr:DoxX family protein [Acetobacter musti]NHN85842.1 DoxX family membrane protein [Acetobacter musti]